MNKRSGAWAAALMVALVLLLDLLGRAVAATDFPRTDITNIGGGKVGLFAPCALQLRVPGSGVKRVYPGRGAKVSFKLKNTGTTAIEGAAVTVRLPPYVTFKSGSASRHAGRPLYDPTTNIVTWPNLNVKGRGGLRLFVSVRTVSECVPTAPLEILIRTDGGQAFCPVEASVSLVRGLSPDKGYCLCVIFVVEISYVYTTADDRLVEEEEAAPHLPTHDRLPHAGADGGLSTRGVPEWDRPVPGTDGCSYQVSIFRYIILIPLNITHTHAPLRPTNTEMPTRHVLELHPTDGRLPPLPRRPGLPARRDALLHAVPAQHLAQHHGLDLCAHSPSGVGRAGQPGDPPSLVDASFVVEEESALAHTIGYLYTLPSGSLVVITLGPGVFPVYPTDLDVDLIIVGSGRRRMLGAGVGQ